ncbi:unnamed protein product [Rotaria sp. Silwood1]|nr:unnamed protein product [Rotaria sp. Silwood1]CAF3543768.1 unnamed protein product [Rotaria sp. Silwood1]CAF4750629.1 unnamed protein product [Rotaria sp. Silwood1]CAF4796782.1 unnamed protein product [Rotaria sp. Silwood1]CAF4913448.1 unnamed protein product [Rotaria sp. Silwood1]
MGNLNSQPTRHTPVSIFYLACRSGDIDMVKRMLTTMKLKEINRLESNGSTALHVAVWYGHLEIVELLLKHGCSTTTINKYGKTAVEECRDERIRQVLQSSLVICDNNERRNNQVCQLKWWQIYENINNEDKSVLATKIMKLRLTTYLINQFKTNEASRTDHIKKIVFQTYDTNYWGRDSAVLSILEKFEKTDDLKYLIILLSKLTPFFKYIYHKEDEMFVMELLIGLSEFKHSFFVGRAYRGEILTTTELDFYLWTYHHRASFIEMRRIKCASKSRSVAERYSTRSNLYEDKISTLFIIYFNEPCETTIDNSEFSGFPDAQEIFIIPGTFFEVTSVKKPSTTNGSSNMAIIELKNISVSRDILLKSINELKKASTRTPVITSMYEALAKI